MNMPIDKKNKKINFFSLPSTCTRPPGGSCRWSRRANLRMWDMISETASASTESGMFAYVKGRRRTMVRF